jgi:hypothetical protein
MIMMRICPAVVQAGPGRDTRLASGGSPAGASRCNHRVRGAEGHDRMSRSCTAPTALCGPPGARLVQTLVIIRSLGARPAPEYAEVLDCLTNRSAPVAGDGRPACPSEVRVDNTAQPACSSEVRVKTHDRQYSPACLIILVRQRAAPTFFRAETGNWINRCFIAAEHNLYYHPVA